MLLVAILVACLALAVTTFLLLDRGAANGAAPSAVASAPPGAAEGAATGAGPSPTPSAAPAETRFTIGYAGDVLTHMPVMDDTAGGGGDIESFPLYLPQLRIAEPQER